MAKVIVTIEDTSEDEGDLCAMGFHIEYIPEREEGEPKSPAQMMGELMISAGIFLMQGVPVFVSEDDDEYQKRLDLWERFIKHRPRYSEGEGQSN
jgi:hypothetical protein